MKTVRCKREEREFDLDVQLYVCVCVFFFFCIALKIACYYKGLSYRFGSPCRRDCVWFCTVSVSPQAADSLSFLTAI